MTSGALYHLVTTCFVRVLFIRTGNFSFGAGVFFAFLKELEISFYSSDIDFIKFIFFFVAVKLPLFSSTYVENASMSVVPSIFLQEFDSSTIILNCIPNPLPEAS